MRVVMLTAWMVVATTSAVWAQSTDSERRNSCTGDAFRFCAGDIPDRGKIEQCLKANRDRLNPDCRAVIDGGKPGGRRR